MLSSEEYESLSKCVFWIGGSLTPARGAIGVMFLYFLRGDSMLTTIFGVLKRFFDGGFSYFWLTTCFNIGFSLTGDLDASLSLKLLCNYAEEIILIGGSLVLPLSAGLEASLKAFDFAVISLTVSFLTLYLPSSVVYKSDFRF